MSSVLIWLVWSFSPNLWNNDKNNPFHETCLMSCCLCASLKHPHLTRFSVDWLPCYRSAFQPTVLCVHSPLHHQATRYCLILYFYAETIRLQLFALLFFFLCVFQGLQGGRTSPGGKACHPSFWEPTSSPAALPGENHGKTFVASKHKKHVHNILYLTILLTDFTPFKIAHCKTSVTFM